jgi:hypothetical protein
MRYPYVAAALLLAAGLAPTANAQTASLLGSGVSRRPIANVPIDTTTNVVGGQLMSTPGLGLGRFFPSLSFGRSSPPTIGQSPYPSPSSFPSTHYPNTFQSFFQPLKK